jgi:hypothetical protein
VLAFLHYQLLDLIFILGADLSWDKSTQQESFVLLKYIGRYNTFEGDIIKSLWFRAEKYSTTINYMR